MKKIKQPKTAMLITMILTTATSLIISCGGGGGASTPATPSTPNNPVTPAAVLTTNNAASVAGAVITSIGLITEPSYIGTASYQDNMTPTQNRSFLNNLLQQSIQNIQNNNQNKKTAAGSADTTTTCTGGGTKREVSNWSGSDSNPDNYTGTITYNNCKESASTWNGTAQITYQGTYQNPTRITTTLNNMTYIDTTANTNLALSSLTTTYGDIVYSGSTITTASSTISGSITGTLNGKGINSTYNSFKMAYTFSGTGMNITLSGKTTPRCVNAEVTVSTGTNAALAIGGRCPSSGQVNITDGVGAMNMNFTAGGGMTVLFNNQTVNSYSSCSQSEGLCL